MGNKTSKWAQDALNCGYDINIVLRYCVKKNYTEAVEYLLENGAEPGNNIFNTRNAKIIRLLLGHGADPNILITIDGIKFLPFLVQKGADINTRFTCTHPHEGIDIHYTAIGDALFKKRKDTVQFLMKHKATLDWCAFVHLRHLYPRMYEKWMREKWTLVKCAVRFLGLHQRAVVTANHPLKKLERGEFNDI